MGERRRRWILAATSAALLIGMTAPASAAADPSEASGFAPAGSTPEVTLSVVSARVWISGGRLHVSGEIRNTSPYRVNGWALVSIKSDSTSQTQGFKADVATYVLAPGARSAFFASDKTTLGSDARITLATAGGHVVENPGAAIGLSTYGDVFSDYTGTGDWVRIRIRNTTARPILINFAAVIFRGSDGKVSNIGKGYQGVEIAAGGVLENAMAAPPSGKEAVSATLEIFAKYRDEVQEYVVSWQNWFQDIDGSSLKASIAWLAEQGITTGCAPFRFCPNDNVTRAQMALFLDRAFDLPPATQDYFDDDDGKTGEASINSLALAGITGGCAPRRFCPTAFVTRAPMALFLDRAIEPPLPLTSTDYFDDDDGKTGEAAINRLAEAGITGGCGTRRYCPSAYVTRAQMAAFLKRALE